MISGFLGQRGWVHIFLPSLSEKSLWFVICWTGAEGGGGESWGIFIQDELRWGKGRARAQCLGGEEMGRGKERVQAQDCVLRKWDKVFILGSKDGGHKIKNRNMPVLWLSKSKDWQLWSLNGKRPNTKHISKKRNEGFTTAFQFKVSLVFVCVCV